MTFKDLVNHWQTHAQCELAEEIFNVHLSKADAAKIDALCEMYPKQSKEQIVSELVSSALEALESSFPYIEGAKVVSRDELGDPIYEDVGPTPEYLSLSKKHLARQRVGESN